MPYQCVSVAKIKPDQIDAVLDTAKELAGIARNESGNVYYNVLRARGVQNTLLLIEKWESEADFLGHVAGDACKNFGAVIDPACDGPSQIYECDLFY